MSETDDKYIGEIFLDLDSRSYQRRIRITGLADSSGSDGRAGKVWPKVVQTFGWVKPRVARYSYEVVANAGDPDTVGRAGRISARTLDRRYRQVSH